MIKRRRDEACSIFKFMVPNLRKAAPNSSHSIADSSCIDKRVLPFLFF